MAVSPAVKERRSMCSKLLGSSKRETNCGEAARGKLLWDSGRVAAAGQQQ